MFEPPQNKARKPGLPADGHKKQAGGQQKAAQLKRAQLRSSPVKPASLPPGVKLPTLAAQVRRPTPFGPQLPGNQAKAPGKPKLSAQGTPKAASGIMGFFRNKFAELQKSAVGKRLTSVADEARKITAGAKAFAQNPIKGVRDGASAVGNFAVGKVDQFKKWYATPEGKAKFWKGVALTAVGLATVVSGGALTAPALALAAGISAAGGVATQVVENKVYNAAAKAKAQKDKKYKFTEKKTFEGVSAKSIAIDAVVGSVGGPIFKFAGKALVGTAAALGKGALPAARGLGQLGAAAAKGSGRALTRVAQKVVPRSVQKLLTQVGKFARTRLAQPAVTAGRKLAAGARKAAGDMVGRARSIKNAAGGRLAAATAKPRAVLSAAKRKALDFIVRETPNLRKLARATPVMLGGLVKNSIRSARALDRKMLFGLRAHVRHSPVVKLATTFRNAVDTLGNKVSRNYLVKGKVALADGLDAMKARMGQKIGQTSVAKYARQLQRNTVQRLDDLVARNPSGHLAKSIVEFRASSTAIRTHLGKVWGEASQGLNKDLSRLLGRYGSVQADFKALAEKGAKEVYDREVAAARQLVKDRLVHKVAQDEEAAFLALQAKEGVVITDAIRQQAAQRGRDAATTAVGKMSDQLAREAETFVARHPSTVLEEAALKAQSLEAATKAADYYFGKRARQKGLLERLGMGLTAPARAPINERIEKYTKVVQALRGSTPLASTAVIGAEAANDVLVKAAQTHMDAPFKAKAKEWKGEKKADPTKKPTAEDGNALVKIFEDAIQEIFPGVKPDELLDDMAKKFNMKDGD
ncbi:hypothetical protein [Deinococcus navajonensis]|uniref:Uncharacterized protein n=1 Tax=Deinococcus navajonensis TaxID=309884 RepID=A0ABV8XTP9_9DEIO